MSESLNTQALFSPNFIAPERPRDPRILRAGHELGALSLGKEHEAWRSQRALFVTGPHASGKSAVVHHGLSEGYAVYDLGPIIRTAFRQSGESCSFGQWLEMNEATHGPHFTDELIATTIAPQLEAKAPQNGAVLIGNRSMKGIRYLQDRLQPSDSKIIYLDAPVDMLYRRYCKRENRHDLTESQFEAILNEEVCMGLLEIRENASHVLDNCGSLDDLKWQLCGIVDQWQPAESRLA